MYSRLTVNTQLYIFAIYMHTKGRLGEKKCDRFGYKCISVYKNFASAGNRTRAARVAGEHSTTEPPMLCYIAFSSPDYRHNTRYSSFLLWNVKAWSQCWAWCPFLEPSLISTECTIDYMNTLTEFLLCKQY